MRTYTIEELQSKFRQFGFIWRKFHLIGIRSKEDKPNEFDDVMYLISDNKIIGTYSCTTNPGTYWLLNLLNVAGAAILKSDKQFLDCWTLGIHKTYEAFVQVRPVTVYRDSNKNPKAEEVGAIQNGLFGINIHRANQFAVSKVIDKWSAGCQVLNDPKQFADLLVNYKLSGFKTLTYTLLKEF